MKELFNVLVLFFVGGVITLWLLAFSGNGVHKYWKPVKHHKVNEVQTDLNMWHISKL